MSEARLLLVGLGNPGAEYAGNRHNIGFMAVDAIARRWGLPAFRARFRGEMAAGEVAGRAVLALKPLTFMNDSGKSVGEAARFYKIPPADVVVFHDELDLPGGRLRVKRGGGAAGHNGLRSIDAHMGADYWRVRLGIGHPGDRRRVLGHVLNDFDAADREWLDPLLERIGEFLPVLVAGEHEAFASRVAQASVPPRPARPRPPRPEVAGSGGKGNSAAAAKPGEGEGRE